MDILLWLVPPALVTIVAMVWVAWIGRTRGEASEAAQGRAQQRFAEAIQRPHPGTPLTPRRPTRERSTGIAVRPSRDQSRRSA